MIFRQITHDDLGCASYLVGDRDAGEGVVVDPRLDVDVYLELAAQYGIRITHVLETHTHADHVSGHGRLAELTGATIHIHAAAGAEYEHEPFEDGWTLELGTLRIEALHTPGHRPEHSAFALSDRARAEEPWAVLTGDTLLVNDVARPDLAIEKREGAVDMYRSIHRKLLNLPPHTEVWPGHLGGSMCGSARMDQKICSTIGFEQRHNLALAPPNEDAFVEEAIATIGHQPPNFTRIVDLNRGPLLTSVPRLEALTCRELVERREAGALLVDVRSDSEFDHAHVPGAISIPIAKAGFGSRLAWLAGAARDVVLIGSGTGSDVDRAHYLGLSAGVLRVIGFLEGGMDAWLRDELHVEDLRRLPAAELRAWTEALPNGQVIDVREREEWEAWHISGSKSIPWHETEKRLDEVDLEQPLAAICASGLRAGIAASLLRAAGAQDVVHVVDGGTSTWRQLEAPLAKER